MYNLTVQYSHMQKLIICIIYSQQKRGKYYFCPLIRKEQLAAHADHINWYIVYN